MQELTDQELLRLYAGQNSEAAFAALVARHVSLVYSAALRKTGDPHAAAEVTQAVFVILAKKARTLGRETILSGWLYQAARLTALNYLRGEIRRARREQEAAMQSLTNEPAPEFWPQIMPLLEDGMGGLGEKDRNAVTLRFFEGKSFQEIAGAFGVSENAAKKRVAYALEKLRKFFRKRGVVVPAAALAAALTANSVQAAPTVLAKTATAIALAKGAAAGGSTVVLANGALKLMAWAKFKTAAGLGAAILLAAGAGSILWREQYIRGEEQKIRTEERQIAAELEQNLPPGQRQQLEASLDALRHRQNQLRAKQDQLRAEDPSPFDQSDLKVSPFTNVRFDGDRVLVTYLGVEYELAAVNGLSTPEVLDYCRREYGVLGSKHFAEDLAVVLIGMKHPMKAEHTVSLTLIDPKTGASNEVAQAAMTADNRAMIMTALHPVVDGK